jgi:ubiquinone/menaquinone biosynthesis C-methylase UbiE
MRHPVFARVWAYLSPRVEDRGIGEHRQRLLAGLSGRVVELGAGNGLNFARYPDTVTEVVAIEPEPYLRGLAVQAAQAASVQITVVDATGEAIPSGDARFDYAVVSLVLCSVADPRLVLEEVRRVLKPGGGLRYYEHVLALRRTPAAVQRFMDATVWPRIAGGCHMSRDTGALIRSAGFSVAHEQRIAVKMSSLEPAIPHILGSARRA